MKKLIFTFFLFFALTSGAQEKYRGIGIGHIQSRFSEHPPFELFGSSFENLKVNILGVFYKSTIAFNNGRRNSMFALSMCPFLGLAYSSNANNQSSPREVVFGREVSMEFPILFEYYIGGLDETNFFLSAGGTINALFFDGGWRGITPDFGPQIGLGAQFEINESRLIGIRGTYTFGQIGRLTVIDESSSISFGVYYSLDY
jgi:hypothetical protein